MKEVMLTTIDNPYNYFTQFDQWLAFDEQNQYFTLELLTRIAKVSDDLSDEENDREIDLAINQIIEEIGINTYKKVFKNEKESKKQD